jgi:thiol:disulfide interchange protein DsbD
VFLHRKLPPLILSVLALLFCARGSKAQFFGLPPKAEASLIADTTAVNAGKPFTVGIRFKVAKGWHLYWKAPGDSGAAPEVQWTLPKGIHAGPIQWPLPHLLKSEGDLFTNVYEGDLLLPVEFAADPDLQGQTVELKGALKWYVCAETCLPGEEQVSLSIPISTEPAKPANADVFADWRARLPKKDPAPFQAEWTGGEGAVFITLRGVGAADAVEIFPIPPQGTTAEHAEADPSAAQGAKRYKIPYKSESPAAAPWAALVVIQSADGSRNGWEISATTSAPQTVDRNQAAAPKAAQPAPSRPLTGVLWAAFLGGLLLNLMPCVLPVIALKIFNFTQQSGQDPRKVFRLGVAFCAGVLVFFLGLAAAVIVLQKAGQTLNWGFQFQNPWILVGLISALFIFGMNLLGVFEITLSNEASQTLSELSSKEGYWGAFLHGMFTTLLGTSCTAPYLGVTLGFAVSQPPQIVITIFLTIAAGMSLPYLLLTSSPRLLRLLPKPGAWMERLKQAMGFVILGVAVWLLDILGAASGIDAVSGASAFLLCLGVGCWMLGILRSRLAGLVIAILLAAAGYRVFLHEPLNAPNPSAKDSQKDSADSIWQPYSRERVAGELAANRPVFVDFTADWCLNCKVNERVTLSNAEVLAAFKDKGVVMLKADWTRGDASITEELNRHGRVGVPFYLLCRPDADQPVAFPEILRAQLLLEELSKLPKK